MSRIAAQSDTSIKLLALLFGHQRAVVQPAAPPQFIWVGEVGKLVQIFRAHLMFPVRLFHCSCKSGLQSSITDARALVDAWQFVHSIQFQPASS